MRAHLVAQVNIYVCALLRPARKNIDLATDNSLTSTLHQTYVLRLMSFDLRHRCVAGGAGESVCSVTPSVFTCALVGNSCTAGFPSFPRARTFTSRPLNAVSLSCLSTSRTKRGSPAACASHRISPDVHSSGRSRIGALLASVNRLSTSAETRAHNTTDTGTLPPVFGLTSPIRNWPASIGGITSHSRAPRP